MLKGYFESVKIEEKRGFSIIFNSTWKTYFAVSPGELLFFDDVNSFLRTRAIDALESLKYKIDAAINEIKRDDYNA